MQFGLEQHQRLCLRGRLGSVLRKAMTAYVSCRGLGLGNGAMQTLIHLAPTSEYDAELIAVAALLEGYKAPRLDRDRLDRGARPELAP